MKTYLVFIKYLLLFLVLKRLVYLAMTRWDKDKFYNLFSVSDTDFNPNVTAIIAGLSYEESTMYGYNSNKNGKYGEFWGGIDL